MASIPPEERILNGEQKRAVEFGDGPLMIIAGAGTGKTTVVTERIKHLIASQKAKPHEILALTFTEKASREMEDRVDRALPYGVTNMWISTFHSFCDRILKNEAISIGLDPGFKLMTEAETILFFRKNIFAFDLTYFRPLGNPMKFIAGMIQHFSRLKDEDVTPLAYLKWVKSQKPKRTDKEQKEEFEKNLELAAAFQSYEDLKVKHGVADYADLISNTLKLFRSRPNILARYQNQFQYILIDEFQDTNFAQNELAVLLAGKKKNITVVGDDDQAIYRWRGAAVSNMLQFRKIYPELTIVVLTKNYRSTKEILDRSYDLIQNNNPDRLEVVAGIDKKLESMRRVEGDKIGILYTQRVENEAELAAKTIIRLLKEHKGYTYADVAILVRANNHAEPFARALTREAIPFQFLGPGHLFRQPEVKDLIAYLKVLYNFEDSVAMYRVLVMDWLGLAPRDVAVLSNYAKKYGISVFEACEKSASGGEPRPAISGDGAPKVIRLVDMIHAHLGQLKNETAGQILYYFLESSGLLKKLAEYKTANEEKIAGNISRFFNKLKTFEAEHEDASVFAVVDWIDLSMNLGESPLATDIDWSENNAVNIMTIHSAKGLEFPIVFLVNLVSQRFPTMERKEQLPVPGELIREILPEGDFHLQEERRLFYVAMTRARDYLFLTAAKYYGEGKREKKLTPFIAEALGQEYAASLTAAVSLPATQLSFLDWKKPEVAESRPIRQAVNYLSYSQLSTFETCPLQYKYRYILKIPVVPSAALAFGDIIHRTMRAFYSLVMEKKRPTKGALLKLLEQNWVSAGFGDKAHEAKMKKHGQELLSGFFEKGYDPRVVPVSLEEAFRIRITPTLTLGGKIDRIDVREDGSLEIIDYKTGATPKSRDVARDPQLTAYALSAMGEGVYKREPEKVFVSFYFFEDQTKVTATRTRDELELAKKDIAAAADEIARSDFRPTPGRHCDFCEFRLICEAWT